MNRRFNFSGIICLILALVFGGITLYSYFSAKGGPSVPRRIFTSLSSFESLEEYEVDTKKLFDADLEELKPEESYVAKVKYNNRVYKIYAYVFPENNDALQYFANIWDIGDTSIYPEGYYRFHTLNLGDTTWSAYYQNCAYKIEGYGAKRFCEFVTWLIEDFPIDINKAHYLKYGRWIESN